MIRGPQDKTRQARATRALVLAYLVAAPVALGAAENPGAIAAGVVYDFADSQRNVDGGFGAHYAYAGPWGAKDAWELRLFAHTLETGVAGATDFYQYGAGLDAIKRLGNIGRGHPYLLAGVGAIANDVTPDEDDGVTFYGNVGVGWRMAPLTGWGVRPRFELRGLYDTFKEGQVDVIAGLTLEIPSARERVVHVERVVEKPVDRVMEKVVEKEVVREVAVPPPDRDADGVADAFDRCPETVAGAKVGPDGCVRETQVVVLPNIEFAYASAELTANGKGTLGMVVRFLKDQPEVTLDVWGHTDAQGEDAYNQRLSDVRAAAVVEFLVSTGVERARLSSAGFGEGKPIASNADLPGRARNRRVELHIRTPATRSP